LYYQIIIVKPRPAYGNKIRSISEFMFAIFRRQPTLSSPKLHWYYFAGGRSL